MVNLRPPNDTSPAASGIGIWRILPFFRSRLSTIVVGNRDHSRVFVVPL
jgi:hypothetical protein